MKEIEYDLLKLKHARLLARAQVYGSMRDFKGAESFLAEAKKIEDLIEQTINEEDKRKDSYSTGGYR